MTSLSEATTQPQRAKQPAHSDLQMIGIVAVAANGVIGRGGKIPWHLPEDLQHFRETTMGHAVLMGRKTWESIPWKYRPLPGRLNLIITRQGDYVIPGPPELVKTVRSLKEAQGLAHTAPLASLGTTRLYVMGGGEVYRRCWGLVDEWIVSQVFQAPEGDTYFPWGDLNAEFEEGGSKPLSPNVTVTRYIRKP
jgi:dihydrofolate reductase